MRMIANVILTVVKLVFKSVFFFFGIILAIVLGSTPN